MTTSEILMGYDKEDLVDMIKSLAIQDAVFEDYIPAGFNTESGFKDQIYAGMIDKDLEMSTVVPSLSNITYDKEGETFYLCGDEVKIVPEFKSLQLYVKDFKITGLIKTEILGNMIKELHSMKVGENQGWVRYLIDYRGHTMVISIKGSISGVKLLKNDHMAKRMYTKYYVRPNIVNWKEIDEDEKIYGSKEISLPNAVDQIEEEACVAMEVLARGMKYPQVANIIAMYGWYYNDQV